MSSVFFFSVIFIYDMKSKYTKAQRERRSQAVKRYYAKLRAAGWRGYCIYGDDELISEVKAVVAAHKARRRLALAQIKQQRTYL